MVGHHQLEDLGCLAAGRGAHIKHRVVGLQVEEERRNHRDDLLAGDEAGVSGRHHEVVNFLESHVFLEKLSGDHHLEKRLVGVVVLTVHSQVVIVNWRSFQ